VERVIQKLKEAPGKPEWMQAMMILREQEKEDRIEQEKIKTIVEPTMGR